jgi:beta-phosphoglucomutase-like phosphatase (HAD superfamily)
VFLEAARQIGVDPKLCMAFEDANLGIQAATAAGMTVVDVRHYYKPAPAAGSPKPKA